MQINELIQIRDNFLNEMQLAAKGSKTSLPFIKNTLSSQPLVKEGQQFQVLIIGGTIFQQVLLKLTNGEIEIVERNKGMLPSFHDRETFLQFVEEHLYADVEIVAVNFAYAMAPISINGKLDGELVWGSKEHIFTGLIGKNIGEEIEQYVKEKLQRTLHVSVANDTICLLLAGLRTNTWDSYAAGIVGTGLNFALFLDQHTAVNLESAEFDKFPLSEAAQALDKTSAVPGSALLEKEIAGAYLYQKYNIEIKNKEIATAEINKSEDLDIIVQDENHPGYAIALEIMEQSAALIAMQISAIMEYHQKSLTFSMAGSLFWKGYQYRENVGKYVHQLSPTYVANFIKNEDAELYGTAKLVA